MTDLKLAVTGAAGRMGQTLIRMIHETPGAILVGALEHDKSEALGNDSGVLAGIGENELAISADANAVITACDGLIDFSVPQATCRMAAMAAEHHKIHVIGTTGCNVDEDAQIAECAKGAVVVKSGNMSLGINLLSVLVERAAASLQAEDFDIEVLEMHHNRKVDAPSGTALLLGEAAASGREIDFATNSVRVRDGITGARNPGSIGFATLRGGSVIGEHSVIFAGNGERIELSHIAQDRTLFATGALTAALWANGKAPGLYSMRDVLGL